MRLADFRWFGGPLAHLQTQKNLIFDRYNIASRLDLQGNESIELVKIKLIRYLYLSCVNWMTAITVFG